MVSSFAPFHFDLTHFYAIIPNTGGSQHTGRPSNQELINREMQNNLLGIYRNTRQLSISYKMNDSEIEQFLRGRIPCYPSMEFVCATKLDLNDVAQLCVNAKTPYKYDDDLEQRRFDRLVYERWLRGLSVREHDLLIQGRVRVPGWIRRPFGGVVYAVEA